MLHPLREANVTRGWIFGIVAGLAACAHAAPSVAPVPVATSLATPDTALPEAIRWATRSAEHRGLYLQVYRNAMDQLEPKVRALPPRSWAVVLDIDETMLDNMGYDEPRARRHEPYIESVW